MQFTLKSRFHWVSRVSRPVESFRSIAICSSPRCQVDTCNPREHPQTQRGQGLSRLRTTRWDRPGDRCAVCLLAWARLELDDPSRVICNNDEVWNKPVWIYELLG